MIIAKSNTHTKKCFTQVQIIQYFLHCKKLLWYNEILPDVSVLPFYCSFSILPPNQELVLLIYIYHGRRLIQKLLQCYAFQVYVASKYIKNLFEVHGYLLTTKSKLKT